MTIEETIQQATLNSAQSFEQCHYWRGFAAGLAHAKALADQLAIDTLPAKGIPPEVQAEIIKAENFGADPNTIPSGGELEH